MAKKGTDSIGLDGTEKAFYAWRKRLGLTQREASAQLGVTVPTFQSYEREERLRSGEYQAPPRMALLAASAIEKGIAPMKLNPKSIPSRKKEK